MKKYVKASKENIDWASIAEANYDKIAEVMEEVHLSDLPYQVDIYLYPNGEVDYFSNPGGNSWLNDDHIVVARINHQYWDIPEYEYDADGNYSPEDLSYLRETIYDEIDTFIERAKRGEFNYEEW